MGVDNFKLEIFCCCCNLRTGSLVIGTLGWLMTLIQLFYLTNPLKNKNRQYQDSNEDIAAEIAYSAVTLIVCISMICGVYKNDRRFILPWLVLKCIECVAWTVITFIIFILYFFMQGIIGMIFIFFITMLATTLCWYFWLCVWSLYNDMTEEIRANMPLTQQTLVLVGVEHHGMKMNEKEPYPVEAV